MYQLRIDGATVLALTKQMALDILDQYIEDDMPDMAIIIKVVR